MILYTWQFSRLSVLLVDSPLLRQGGFLIPDRYVLIELAGLCL